MIKKYDLNQLAIDIAHDFYKTKNYEQIFSFLKKYISHYEYSELFDKWIKIDSLVDTEEDKMISNIFTFLIKCINRLESENESTQNEVEELEQNITSLGKYVQKLESSREIVVVNTSVLDRMVEDDITNIHKKLHEMPLSLYNEKINLILQILDN